MSVQFILALLITIIVRVLELVDSINLNLIDANRERSSRSSDNIVLYKGGHSLTGKTTILHIVIPRSILGVSIFKLEKLNLVERNSEDV